MLGQESADMRAWGGFAVAVVTRDDKGTGAGLPVAMP
jgi:hypothetical protein